MWTPHCQRWGAQEAPAKPRPGGGHLRPGTIRAQGCFTEAVQFCTLLHCTLYCTERVWTVLFAAYRSVLLRRLWAVLQPEAGSGQCCLLLAVLSCCGCAVGCVAAGGRVWTVLFAAYRSVLLRLCCGLCCSRRPGLDSAVCCLPFCPAAAVLWAVLQPEALRLALQLRADATPLGTPMQRMTFYLMQALAKRSEGCLGDECVNEPRKQSR